MTLYLGDVRPVAAFNRHVPTKHRRGNFRAGIRVEGAIRGEGVVTGQRPVGRGRGDGLGNLAHGFGAGQRPVSDPAVRLPLLPLVQLPHGVVPYGAALLCSRGLQRPVVHRPRHTADAVWPQHVTWERPVALGIAWDDLCTVARHVSRQCLVGRNAGRQRNWRHY